MSGNVCRRPSSGFTLIEVSLAMALLLIVVLLAYRLLFTVQDSTDRTSINAYLHNQGRIVSEALIREIHESRIVSVASQNDSMVIQVPVDYDGDGDVLDGAGLVEYGFRDPANAQAPRLSWTATYSTVVDETHSEAALRIDINKDGDKTDTFVSCRLERVVRDGGGVERDRLILARDIYLIDSPRDADLNGDGTADPLFKLVDASGAEVAASGTKMILDLWVGHKAPGPEYFLHNAPVEVKLRNTQ
ncbi:MAG TPA: prepilin-type N-terminal cleavage/methylation domain-containing protein [Planctomycetota bacterium]|nr:prepilin-type N-terminal cleavage/methylation domain-containing protein [Planctomycetota bacterium]